MESIFCLKAEPFFFFFASDVPHILYYSHIPTALISLLIGLFVFLKDRTSIIGKSLLFLSVSFFVWAFIDLILWAQADSRLIMFFWSIIILIELLIFFGGLYMVYVFINKKDAPFYLKTLAFALLLPVIISLPTIYNLSGFNIIECISFEGIIAAKYAYILEALIILWIIGLAISGYRKADVGMRKQIILLSVGVSSFLLSFSGANFISSLLGTDVGWEYGNYGLFGMPIFIGFLTFLIVRYKAFDIKLIGAQALIISQFVLIGSMFFFTQSLTNRILIGMTLVIVSGAGWFLLKSVKKEIQRKEELQEMSDRLARANDELRKLDNAKSEFISIASHQLRTPLTAIKGFLSLILEGSYGKVSPELQEVLNKVYASNERIVQLVENLLNISRIESGRIQYQFEKSPIETLLKELSDMFFVMAKNKKLTLTFTLPKKKLPLIYMDAAKIREVISNLIDNAFKYTAEGGIEVILEQRGAVARITVADTGMGVEPETIPHLFSKFIRGSKEASRMNVAGTGLGLYVGRSFIEAHHGKIWIESEGKGKGSRFIIELPIVGE